MHQLMNCKICKKKITEFHFKKIPLVNNFIKNKLMYSNGFAYCPKCDLGFNINFIEDKILYNKKYLYNGSLNSDKIEIFADLLKKKKL